VGMRTRRRKSPQEEFADMDHTITPHPMGTSPSRCY